MSVRKTREIAELTICYRRHKGVYLPGALDRIVARVEREQRNHDCALTDHQYLDALDRAIAAEEKHPDRDVELFDTMALPGWREWAVCAGEMP